MNNDIISYEHIVLITTSVILGTLARVLTLKEDYHQYPSFPNGYLTHLVTGFIASSLGAVAIPAIMTKDFSAFTFLALALEQFREVRRIESESLRSLDDADYSFRGDAYIDGIAKTFEARNYFSILVSFACGLTIQLVHSSIVWVNVLSGVTAGSILFFLIKRFSKGKTVGDIADVTLGTINVKASDLYVDDVYVTSFIGTDFARELVEKEGLAAVIYPRKKHFRITLDNSGQRQAILFEACRSLGLKRYNFTKKDFRDGRIAIFLVPILHDENALIETIKKTPLLESVKKSPSVMKTKILND